MVNRIDISLDDIIKSNKKRNDGQRRGTFRGTQRAGGGVQRGRNRGGIQRPHTSAGRSALKHVNVARKSVLAVGGILASRLSHTKLLVSNLDFAITDSDIEELFSEFGELTSVAVHYDRSGKSQGTAEVIFERKTDAIIAMKQFGGVLLDGRPMCIQMTASAIPTIFTSGRLGGGGVQQILQPQTHTQGSGVNRQSQGPSSCSGRQHQKKTLTTGKLDAELEAYNKKRTRKPSTKEELDTELDNYNKEKKTQKS